MAKDNKEKDLLEAINILTQKVDNLSEKVGTINNDRLDNETVALITAAAYNLFCKRVAIKNVRLVDNDPTGKKRFRQFNVVGY